MIVLGLTGSIGMGKSTLASMMRNLKIPVHEADTAVHALLKPGTESHMAVAATFPYFEFPEIYEKKTKSIKRSALGALVFSNDEKRKQLEAILHPRVQQTQEIFLQQCRQRKVKFACLDIPLLFETHAEKRVDYTIVVTAPAFIQRQRVLSRPNMNEKKFNAILNQQMPDAEKRAKADYIIHTGLGLAQSFKALKLILKNIEEKEFPKTKEKKEKIIDPRNRPRY